MHPTREESECSSKQPYTWREAKEVLSAVGRRFYLRIYECSFCKKYHLTKKPEEYSYKKKKKKYNRNKNKFKNKRK